MLGMQKLKNILNNKLKKLGQSKQFIAAQKLNLFFFPFLYFLVFVLIFMESYMYSGFLQEHIFIDLRLILAIFVFSGIWAKTSLSKRIVIKQIYSYYQLISSLNKLFLPAIIFLVFFLFSIENANFPGYIYTRVLHVEPKILFFVFLVGVFVFILDFDNYLIILFKGARIKKTFLQNPTHLLFLILISWILLSNILKSVSYVYARLAFILKNPQLTYEEKMRKGWGRFYDYMMFINENTPPNATIMHPPHDPPWEKVGNGGLVRYFIYPRDEVYFFNKISNKGNKPTHMMIAYGWPDFPVKAKKIIYMPRTATESAQIIYEDYSPDDPRNKDKDVLGIIELEE